MDIYMRKYKVQTQQTEGKLLICWAGHMKLYSPANIHQN